MNDSHEHDKHNHESMKYEEHGAQPDKDMQNIDSSVNDHSAHAMHSATPSQTNAHAGHTDHSGHEDMFRKRFWISLLLSIPVLLYTPMLQMWFGFRMPEFLGSQWVTALFAVIVFVYGCARDSYSSARYDVANLACDFSIIYI
jgi:P-type Cu2+ transporter